MKIEIGESIFYSWLRHVKECQIVQNNWKVSPNWKITNEVILDEMFRELQLEFEQKYFSNIFKNNKGLSQFIKQSECDAIGINYHDNIISYYAVDVAYHENGLKYGDKMETAFKVIAKCIRTAFCIYGYFDSKEAEIVFASPVIKNATLKVLLPMFDIISEYFTDKGFSYNFRLICNDDFEEKVLNPVLIASSDVADTTELFVRSYQMLQLFSSKEPKPKLTKSKSVETNISSNPVTSTTAINELKVGKIAQIILKGILESGKVTENEILLMQEEEYSRKTFGLSHPLLVLDGVSFDARRYYSTPLTINKKTYYLCNDWYETKVNDDRTLLLKWISQYN